MEEQERLAAAEAAAVEDEDIPETSSDGKKGGKKKNMKKKKSSVQRKNTQKKMTQGGGGDLTQKMFATMEKHKEVFFTIRLHSAQSAASLSPIQVITQFFLSFSVELIISTSSHLTLFTT